jgi:hypothetical protein
MIIDLARGLLPALAGVFEVADEFAFLGVDADDGEIAVLEAVAQVGEIFELQVAVGAGVGGDLFAIDAQRIAQVVEQTGHGIGRDDQIELGQFLGDGRGGSSRPA